MAALAPCAGSYQPTQIHPPWELIEPPLRVVLGTSPSSYRLGLALYMQSWLTVKFGLLIGTTFI